MRFRVSTQAHHFTQAGVVIIVKKILLALTLESCMMRNVKFQLVETTTATQSLRNVTYDMDKSRANDDDKQAQIETMCRRDSSSGTIIDLCEFAKSYLQSNYKVWMVPMSSDISLTCI